MISDNLKAIKQELGKDVRLVVVSKFRPIEQLLEVYETGQRHFAENRVQEMLTKYEALPKDILWHMIGHLQTNKVKYIAPFVHLIHSLHSLELALEINKQAIKNNRNIPVLMQFHIAKEESKYGFEVQNFETALTALISMSNIEICGVMGMATQTNDDGLIRGEFELLKSVFDQIKKKYFENSATFRTISMGMSNDFKLAVEEGSTMVRIGSLVFA